MKKVLVLLLILCAGSLIAQVNIIPLPNQIKSMPGQFVITEQTQIFVPPQLKFEALWLQNYLRHEFAISPQMRIEITQSDNYIRLTHVKGGSPESYTLSISPTGINILAPDNAGIFYGLQSLIQMLSASKSPILSCMEIRDEPRFRWRGMHLDCCRHFFGVEDIKKYLDYLALYKMNTFHWHLTEDQGWRIEIKRYPQLTEIGSKRKGTMVGHYSDQKWDSIPYGGYYSQEQIKEIVEYARERHITVVPEIEMPGHALAALAAFPQFSCTGGPFEVATSWGVFDNVFCAGNDSTFIFLQNILDEVLELFPSEYIHIGGDECPKTRWKTCPKCQERMKTNKLKDEHELQSYFIQRVEKYLNAKGRKIIGWDEILEGGLAPNAAVMSWRGIEGGISAARQKHFVVMSPGSPCYFDHYQFDKETKQPIAIGGYNPLDMVYAYEPIPDILTKEERGYNMGAQGNVWTEYMKTFSHVEFMALPRMAALAEVVWTLPENKNYEGFLKRLEFNKVILDKMGANYARQITE